MQMASMNESRASSCTSAQFSINEKQLLQKTLVQFSRSHRRSVLARTSTLSLFTPVKNPKDLSRWYRLLLLSLLTICASIDPIASTSFFPVLPQIASYFDQPRAVANLCSTLDFAGVATTALFWSFLAERHGRKTILMIALATTTLFTTLGALATSLGMLIAMRVLSSASAAGMIVTGVAAVGDMWETQENGLAMGIFFLGPLMSPTLGPVIGGALGQRWGWRSVLWFIVAWASFSLLLVVFVLPETRQANLPLLTLSQKETAIPGSFDQNGFKRKRWLRLTPALFYKPLKIFVLLRYPLINLLLIAVAFSYSLTAVFSITMQSTLSAPPYRFNAFSIGLLFIPYAVGAILASVLGGKLSDHFMRRRASQSGILVPEHRVHYNAWAACVLEITSLLTLGWSFHFNAPWYAIVVPALALGVSFGLNLGILSTILVELIPAQAPGLIALNSMARNVCGAIGGSVTQPLVDQIGTGWLYTGLCVFVSMATVSIYVTIFFKGEAWRAEIWRAEGVARDDAASCRDQDDSNGVNSNRQPAVTFSPV